MSCVIKAIAEQALDMSAAEFPAGRLIPCITSRLGTSSPGRGAQFGDGQRVASASQCVVSGGGLCGTVDRPECIVTDCILGLVNSKALRTIIP